MSGRLGREVRGRRQWDSFEVRIGHVAVSFAAAPPVVSATFESADDVVACGGMSSHSPQSRMFCSKSRVQLGTLSIPETARTLSVRRCAGLCSIAHARVLAFGHDRLRGGRERGRSGRQWMIDFTPLLLCTSEQPNASAKTRACGCVRARFTSRASPSRATCEDAHRPATIAGQHRSPPSLVNQKPPVIAEDCDAREHRLSCADIFDLRGKAVRRSLTWLGARRRAAAAGDAFAHRLSTSSLKGEGGGLDEQEGHRSWSGGAFERQGLFDYINAIRAALGQLWRCAVWIPTQCLGSAEPARGHP